MYSFARSRRLPPITQPGAPFLGYNGPNFMQQTNFTSTNFQTESMASSNAWQDIGPELNLAELALSETDFVQITALIFMDNVSGGTRRFQVGVKVNGGAVESIQDFNADDGTTPGDYVDLSIRFQPGPLINEIIAWVQSSIIADPGLTPLATNIGTGAGEAPNSLQFQVKSDAAGATIWIHAGTLTRIRQGIT